MTPSAPDKSGLGDLVTDTTALWHALAEDTALPVMVVNVQGSIEFANASALSSSSNGAAKSLADLFGPEFATERAQHINDAVASNSTVTVDAIQNGRLMRTTIRPIASNGHPSRRALLVTRPAPGPGADRPGTNVIRAKTGEAGPLGQLTPRELEILGHIGRGLSTAEIAKELGRSVKTVEWHRVSLGEKLGVTNRVELARIAIASGLVSLDAK